MTITVRYARFEFYTRLNNAEPLRPYVAVRLQNGGRHMDTLGLVDSGADSSLFNSQFAQALGLDPFEGKRVDTRGVGGVAPTLYFDIFLTVHGKRFLAHVGFTDTCPAQFGLLGRDDFFKAFNVGFDQRGTQVLLHPLS